MLVFIVVIKKIDIKLLICFIGGHEVIRNVEFNNL